MIIVQQEIFTTGAPSREDGEGVLCHGPVEHGWNPQLCTLVTSGTFPQIDFPFEPPSVTYLVM